MKITLDKKLSLFFLLIIIVILNFIIFVPKFIYGDEAWSAKVSSFGLIDAIKNSLNDFHPPLYHIFLSLILYIIPHNETFLKFLSLLFGILTIYIILFKLNEFIGEEESKILSILLAISPTFLYIFTLVRMYSLSIFLMTLSILFFFKILKSENKKDKILYIISNILMMLTHHLTVPLFFIEGLYLIIKKRWSLLKTFILNLFIYLPFSYIFLIQLKRRMELSRGWGNIFIESFFKDFFSYLFLNIKDASIFIILNFLILIFIGLYKNLIKFKEDKTFFVLFFLIYFIMFFVVTKLLGSLYFHYISLIIIPSYLLLVEGSFFLKKYKEKVLIFIIIIL
ncbi:MAG: glycosyltransferase family 39 protein, partial [Caldisericia bacterium]|nr:glycosyltransferase family 39 protein [Caldisericia bacterium]